jgi:hypothetical protein
MELDKLNHVLLFTCDRKLKNQASQFLTILEARIIYIKRLEATLTKMGIEGYEDSVIDYQKDRKAVLDYLNTSLRELEEIKKMV